MIDQQINLYKDVLIPQKLHLSLQNMMISIICFVILLGVVHGFFRYQIQLMNLSLKSLENEMNTLQTQIDQAMEKNKPIPIDQNLAAQVRRLINERDGKRLVLQNLSHGIDANGTGFSKYLIGLARQQVAGLWLNSIEIAEGGQFIGLQGKTTQPELIPQLIQNLSKEAVFNGVAFSNLALNRKQVSKKDLQNKKKVKDNHLHFVIQTRKREKKVAVVTPKNNVAQKILDGQLPLSVPQQNKVNPSIQAITQLLNASQKMQGMMP